MDKLFKIVVACLMVETIFGGLPKIANTQETIAYNFDYPIKDYVITGYEFGDQREDGSYHLGEDIGKSEGIIVYACADGIVKLANNNHTGNGNYGGLIIIEHTLSSGEKVCSLYGHLDDSKTLVRPNSPTAEVKCGQQIGNLGKKAPDINGNFTPHLHFGIRYGSFPGEYSSDSDVTSEWYWGGYGKIDPNTKVNWWLKSSKIVSEHIKIPPNKSLVKSSVLSEPDIYWFQNDKLYLITESSIIDKMSSLEKWGWDDVIEYSSGTFQNDILDIYSSKGIRHFISPTDPESNGLLIRLKDDDKVYLIGNGKRNYLTKAEFDSQGFKGADVIDVTHEIFELFPNASPIKPALISPINSSTNIDPNNITFSWSGSDPDGDNLRYWISIYEDKDGEAGKPVLPYDEIDGCGQWVNGTSFSYNFEPNQKYWWAVWAQDSVGKWSPCSGWWSYTTAATPSNVLFSDNFNDGNFNGWDIDSGNPQRWKVENGECIVQLEPWGLTTNMSTGEINWSDYTFEVDIMGVEGVDKIVAFRYLNPDNTYLVNIRDLWGGSEVVVLAKNQEGIHHSYMKTVEFENDLNKWYRLKVELLGSKIKIYIDNQLLIDYDDVGTKLTCGKIGLVGFRGDMGLDTVHFDNVIVYNGTINPPLPESINSGIIWTKRANLPISTGGIYDSSAESVACINGKVYAFGGWNSNAVYEYNPFSDTWTQKTSMPSARGGAVALPFNGKVYLAGGNPEPYGSPNLDIYDPQTDSWSTKSPMPDYSWGGWGVAGGAVDDKLYIMGGWNGINHEENFTREYNVSADAWSMKTPMPIAVDWMNAAVYKNKLCIIGGDYGTGEYTTINQIQIYDSLNDAWNIVKGLPAYLDTTGVVTYNNKLYILGGRSVSPPFPTSFTSYKYNLNIYSYNFDTGIFVKEGNMPAQDMHQVTQIGNKVYLIGAGNNGNETWEGVITSCDIGIPTNNEPQTLYQDSKDLLDVIIDPNLYSANFKINWPGSDLDLALINPNGIRINPQSGQTDFNITFSSTPVSEFYTVQSPIPGKWTMEITAIDVAPEGEKYTASVTGTSTLLLKAETDKPEYLHGEAIKVLAKLSDPDPVLGATVTGEVQPPSGSSVSLSFNDNGTNEDAVANDGIYTSIYSNTSIKGEYVFSIVAKGKTKTNEDFSRTASVSTSADKDSDNDSIPDVWEDINQLDKFNNDAQADPDNDTLNNLAEYQYNTNPQKSDSDGDGYSDAEEIQAGSNPNDKNSVPIVAKPPTLEALGMKQTGSIVVITFKNTGEQPAYLSKITKITVPSGIKCSDALPIYLSSEIQPGTTTMATLHFNTITRVRFGFNLEWQDNKGNIYSK